MNLPGHYVHHISGGFGLLILPWFGGRWLIWFRGNGSHSLPGGFRLKDHHFHNCTTTGVY